MHFAKVTLILNLLGEVLANKSNSLRNNNTPITRIRISSKALILRKLRKTLKSFLRKLESSSRNKQKK
jgi:hypothetical protein